jgi:Tfp pilus assembly protein PilN
MKSVNLIPRDARQSRVGPSLGKLGASHFIVGLMLVAVAFVTVYVLTNNTVSQRKAQLASLHQQVARMQSEVSRLQSYQQFEKLEEARAATVRDIASQRFDWHGALSDLSKVVPANTSLQSLVATVSPSSGSGGAAASGGGGTSVRADIAAPAFELKGCTGSQDEVAQLMSRLRVINGVTRVTLEDSSKQTGSASSGTGSATSNGCPAQGPTFDMVVFFQPVAGAASATGQTVSTTPGATK